MITTTLGDMDESTLDKREGVIETEHERTAWVEYRLPGQEEIIHRSVHVHLKQTVLCGTDIGGFVNG